MKFEIENIKKESVERLSLFLIGWLGINFIVILLSIFDFLLIPIIETLDINLFENRLSFSLSGSLNFVVYYILFVILIFIINKTSLRKIVLEFKLAENIKEGIVFGVILLTVSILLNSIVQFFSPETTSNQNETMVRQFISLKPMMSLITVGIIGPIAEEITYRYGLFKFFRKFSRPLAYVLTIIVFSLIHFTFSADPKELINELLNLPSYMVAAFILCYAYDRKGNISVPMIAHIFNNSFPIILNFLLILLSELL